MLKTTLTIIEVGVSYKFEKDYTFIIKNKNIKTFKNDLLAKYEKLYPKRHFIVKKKI